MPVSSLKLIAAAIFAAAFAFVPASALAATTRQAEGGGATAPGSATAATGGVSPNDPQFQPASKAKLVGGIAIPPADAPPEVVNAINAANSISGLPYKYGGGHASFQDNGYDCSGTVSYVLNGAGLLGGTPLDSGSFMRWGARGKGKWFTVYTNPGHAFIMIAGLRFDTGYRDNTIRGLHPGRGPRWGKARVTRGFTARHPDGF
jgi:cell wall-associated NlpC family hydrolase